MKSLLLLIAALAVASASMHAAPDCAQCLQVVKYVQTELRANATNEEVEKFVDNVCEKLGPAADECKSYVQQYVPEVINMVAMKIQPEKICNELHMCNKSSIETLIPLGPGPVIGGTGLDLGFENPKDEPIMPAAIELPQAEEKHVGASGELCVICEFVMAEVQKELEANGTEKQIEQLLDKVCDILPSTIKTTCENLVTTYTPQIVALLVNKVKPDQVCTSLGLCNKTKHTEKKGTFFPQQPRREGEGPLCPICEQVIKYIDSLLANNATDQQIIQAVEAVCQYLPQADQDKCKAFVEQYGAKVIAELIKTLQPTAICDLLKLCSTSKTSDLRFLEELQ